MEISYFCVLQIVGCFLDFYKKKEKVTIAAVGGNIALEIFGDWVGAIGGGGKRVQGEANCEVGFKYKNIVVSTKKKTVILGNISLAFGVSIENFIKLIAVKNINYNNTLKNCFVLNKTSFKIGLKVFIVYDRVVDKKFIFI